MKRIAKWNDFSNHKTSKYEAPLEAQPNNTSNETGDHLPCPCSSTTISDSSEMKKSKKKSLSRRFTTAKKPKKWLREDAIKVLELEKAYEKKSLNAPVLLVRFPDPELNRSIVSNYSSDIASVHFQHNSAPRCCLVHLKEGADVQKTIQTISAIKFGTGYVTAEVRLPSATAGNSVDPDSIDPYTLYIGNIANSLLARSVKEHFPGAVRVDIGFAQRLKGTRYAFARYDSVEKAMDDFKRSVNTLLESRSLIVRFLRKNSQRNDTVNPRGTTPSHNLAEEITAAAEPLPIPPMLPTTTTDVVSNTSAMNSRDKTSEAEEKWLMLRDHPNRNKVDMLPTTTASTMETTAMKSENIPIKEETGESDMSEEEEGMPSLLGMRYTADVANVRIKKETDLTFLTHTAAEPSNAASCNYHDELGLSEDENDNCSSSAKPINWSGGLLDRKPLCDSALLTEHVVEIKPDIVQLQKTNNFAKHTFLEQRRRTKETELDDLFAQMNSDNDDDDYF